MLCNIIISSSTKVAGLVPFPGCWGFSLCPMMAFPGTQHSEVRCLWSRPSSFPFPREKATMADSLWQSMCGIECGVEGVGELDRISAILWYLLRSNLYVQLSLFPVKYAENCSLCQERVSLFLWLDWLAQSTILRISESNFCFCFLQSPLCTSCTNNYYVC